MSTNTLPIVGAFHYPPAKALLDALAIGTPLYLLAAPDNQYDSFAVAVYLNSESIPAASQDALSESLPAFGFELSQILEQETWQLGHVPKEMARTLRETGQVLDEQPVPVTFSTSTSGAPRVRREEPFDLG